VLRLDAVTPNDPFWGQQWGPVRVRAPHAWEETTGSTDVVVAVLDTGVSAHPDLDGALLAGRSFVSSEPTVEDDNGHGTGVAGVIAARGDNGTAIAGMCWSCRILPVKVLDAAGSGSTSAVAEGIRWATDQGADIINISLGGPDTTSTLDSAIRYAVDAGVVLIAAAGNEGKTAKNYPAASSGVIGVAASDSADQRYSWSNHGSWVDVAAPGCVLTLTTEGGVGGACGTSFAAPIVAGTVALARTAAHASVPAEVIIDAVTSTSLPRTYVAHGRVDAGALLLALVDDAAEPVSDPLAEPVSDEEPVEEPTQEPTEEPLIEEPIADPTIRCSTSRAPIVEEPVLEPLERLAGADRFETAVALSRSIFGAGVCRACSSRRARTSRMPSPPRLSPRWTRRPSCSPARGRCPCRPRRSSSDLRPHEIVIVGGPGVILPEVEAQLALLGPVRRIAGSDRFATAAALAGERSRRRCPLPTSPRVRTSPTRCPAVPSLRGTKPPPADEPNERAACDRRGPDDAASRTDRRARGSSSIDDAVLEALRPLATTGTVTRQSGADRFSTSAVVSRAAYPSGRTPCTWRPAGRSPMRSRPVPWPESSAAPLLLTARDVLPPAVAAELARPASPAHRRRRWPRRGLRETFAAAARAAGIDS
jgi:hypothetical protein